METQNLGEPAARRSNNPLIINACLTGIVPTKAANPRLPISVAEIIDDAGAVVAAGASMLHIHARHADGAPDWRPEAYACIIEGIRDVAPDVIIVTTTSGRIHTSLEQRAAVLDLDGGARPDMASLTLGSLNFPGGVSANPPDIIQELATRMRARGILPELEVFDLGMLNYAHYLVRKNILNAPCYVNLLMGSLGAAPARVDDLCHLVREIPDNWTWAATGIGQSQLPINAAAIVMGGHVRVGLEDNLYYDEQRRVAASNRMLVERVVRLAQELERPISSVHETRARLGLASPTGARISRLDTTRHTPG